jgi:hypothetical protein
MNGPTDVLLEALREIRQRLWDPTLVVPGELARLVWDLRGIVAKAQAEHGRRGREAACAAPTSEAPGAALCKV